MAESSVAVPYHVRPSHAETRFKAKHSLDSDEEDDEDEVQQEGLGEEDLAAQEDSSTVVSENNAAAASYSMHALSLTGV